MLVARYLLFELDKPDFARRCVECPFVIFRAQHAEGRKSYIFLSFYTIGSIISGSAVGGCDFDRVSVRFFETSTYPTQRLQALSAIPLVVSLLISYVFRTARSPPDSFIRDVNTAVGIRAYIRGRASVRAVSTYPCITLEYVTRPPASPQRF